MLQAGQRILGRTLPVRITGSGDTSYHYVELAVKVVLAVAMAMLWHVAVRRAPVSPRTRDHARMFIRYVLGGSNYFLFKPLGWWIDDVTVEATRWSTVYSGGANQKTLAHRATGTYCYRARGRHVIDGVAVPGNWSEVVTIGVLR